MQCEKHYILFSIFHDVLNLKMFDIGIEVLL